ncbi:MAG: PKD domain-containing protein [Anaerolineae bacterium]|nr:PKD domain-containing protein [Anaerolineae bacterium]
MKRSLILVVVLFPLFGLAALLHTARLQASPPPSGGVTFTVNSTIDATDVNPGDGVCETAVGNGECTLRAAVQEANVTAAGDTILLPAGLYQFTILGQGDETAATGDLDIAHSLIISGTGLATPVVDGNNLDRVFHILAGEVQLKGITVQHGHAGFEQSGGGIYNQGSLIIWHSIITDNLATGFQGHGGGIYNTGELWLRESVVVANSTTGQEGYGAGIRNTTLLTVENSLISGNGTTGRNGHGGGIYSSARLSIISSRISSNTTDDYEAFGAGLYIQKAPTIIINSTFDHNRTGVSPGVGVYGNGAGIYQWGDIPAPHLTIIDSTFLANYADGNGGGLFAWGNVDITRTTFISNSATRSGGGIFAMYNHVNLWDSTLIANSTDYSGGAIHLRNNGTLEVKRSLIANNTTLNNGGGIEGTGHVVIENSTIRNNTAWAGGGIYLFHPTSLLRIEGSTISGNAAVGSGGGMFLAAPGTISNTTISGNTVEEDGGGLMLASLDDASIHLFNTTVTQNVADYDADNSGDGGGIYVYNPSDPYPVHSQNTLVAQNADLSSEVSYPDCIGLLVSQGYNLVGMNTGCVLTPTVGDLMGTSNYPINALLGPLRDNGGPTPTHGLLVGSPAMEAGSPAVPGSGGNACPPGDQRGIVRPVDGDTDGDPRCDIGAVEGDLPILDLTAASDSPTMLGHATTLTATSSGGTNVQYQWNLGNGLGDAGAVITHSYPMAGVYTAVVSATNSVSTLTATTTIEIVDEAIAGLTAVNDSPTILGHATNLTATVSAGTSISYTWDFGDGATGSGPHVSHVYLTTGSYTATVTATNSVNSHSTTTVVTVTVLPLIAPTAVDDTAETNENEPVLIDVLANDVPGSSGDPVLDSVSEPGNGTAVITDTFILYTPAPDFFGIDTFTYTITDGVLTDTAVVTVTVLPVNDQTYIYLPVVLKP